MNYQNLYLKKVKAKLEEKKEKNLILTLILILQKEEKNLILILILILENLDLLQKKEKNIKNKKYYNFSLSSKL